MNQELLAEIGRTQRLEILNSLKRTKGMSVNELVGKMKMSYMGIKQHCLTLQRDGYLDTWRRPQKMGRPEMVYRLTRRSHDLYPSDSNHPFDLTGGYGKNIEPGQVTSFRHNLDIASGLLTIDLGLRVDLVGANHRQTGTNAFQSHREILVDRKSTRLNSSHLGISYA